MTKLFRTAFLEALAASDMTVADIARKSGVSKDQLNKLKQRENAKTNVDDAIKVAAAFGQNLDCFLGNGTSSSQNEIAQLLSALSEQERDFLLKAARGLAERDQADD